MTKMFDEVDFEIDKEGWNQYELTDGRHRVTLRMRVILTKIWKPKIIAIEEPTLIGIPKESQPQKKAPKDEFQMSFQDIVVVGNCPAELMGTPSQPVPPEELSQLKTDDVEFTAFNEDWNVYLIPSSGMKLKVKLIVSSVAKAVDRYDQFGYPFYVVQSTNAVVAVPPKTKK